MDTQSATNASNTSGRPVKVVSIDIGVVAERTPRADILLPNHLPAEYGSTAREARIFGLHTTICSSLQYDMDWDIDPDTGRCCPVNRDSCRIHNIEVLKMACKKERFVAGMPTKQLSQLIPGNVDDARHTLSEAVRPDTNLILFVGVERDLVFLILRTDYQRPLQARHWNVVRYPEDFAAATIDVMDDHDELRCQSADVHFDPSLEELRHVNGDGAEVG